MAYWYCTTHNTVEGDEGCPNSDRLGPYPTAEAAGRAYETAAKRTEAWDHDPAWNDEDD